eukprot:1159344-Pelagomonas_calceolata.AAC.12
MGRKMIDYASTAICSHTIAALLHSTIAALFERPPSGICCKLLEGGLGSDDEAEQVLVDSILLPADGM